MNSFHGKQTCSSLSCPAAWAGQKDMQENYRSAGNHLICNFTQQCIFLCYQLPFLYFSLVLTNQYFLPSVLSLSFRRSETSDNPEFQIQSASLSPSHFSLPSCITLVLLFPTSDIRAKIFFEAAVLSSSQAVQSTVYRPFPQLVSKVDAENVLAVPIQLTLLSSQTLETSQGNSL